MVNNKKCTRICVVSLGIALGVAKGLGMMLFAWAGWLWGHGVTMIDQVGLMYHGFAPTFKGGLVGLGWGFLCGFILGVVIAFVYNLCVSCCPAGCCKVEK